MFSTVNIPMDSLKFEILQAMVFPLRNSSQAITRAHRTTVVKHLRDHLNDSTNLIDGDIGDILLLFFQNSTKTPGDEIRSIIGTIYLPDLATDDDAKEKSLLFYHCSSKPMSTLAVAYCGEHEGNPDDHIEMSDAMVRSLIDNSQWNLSGVFYTCRPLSDGQRWSLRAALRASHLTGVTQDWREAMFEYLSGDRTLDKSSIHSIKVIDGEKAGTIIWNHKRCIQA